MDVRHLTYIIAIAEQKNMTRAARELFVTQSSLSQHLSRLEKELGTPLFFRARNELALTPAGELYVEAARKVIQIQKELYQNIACLDQRGHITVGATSNFALRMLAEIIPRFKEEYPAVSIEISEMGLPALLKMLSQETLDLGIAASVTTAPLEDQARILRQEEVFFAVPADHPYVQENPSGFLTAQELVTCFARDNFILSRRGSSLRELSDRLFAACRFTPCAFCETNNIATSRSMVANHAGVTFVAESCSVDRDLIRYYSLAPALLRLNVLYTRKNWAMGQAEKRFCGYLTDYFRQHTEKPYLAERYAGTGGV